LAQISMIRAIHKYSDVNIFIDMYCSDNQLVSIYFLTFMLYLSRHLPTIILIYSAVAYFFLLYIKSCCYILHYQVCVDCTLCLDGIYMQSSTSNKLIRLLAKSHTRFRMVYVLKKRDKHHA
jgi:hypothetical protein